MNSGNGVTTTLKTDIFQLGRNSVAYVIGHLATRAISFLLLPLYTNALTPEDYGVLSLAFTFAAFCLIVFHFGIDSALLKFFTGARPDRQKEIFTTVYLTQVAVAALLAAGLFLARDVLAPVLLGVDRPDWMALLIGVIIADTLWAHPMHLRRAEGKALTYAGLSVMNATVLMAGNIVLIAVMGLGITGALLANLMASCLLLAVNLPTVFRNLAPRTFSRERLRELLGFGLPFLPAGLFTMVMELADRYLLRWLTDLETVGLYSAGYKLGLFMLLLVGGFSLGWQPFFLRRGRQPGAPQVFARITTYLLVFFGCVLLTISAWIEGLVRLPLGPVTIFGPAYWPATRIVPIILLAYFCYALYVVQMPGVHLTQRTRWVMLFRGSGAAVNIGLNLYLIPRYGALGAAWVTCISFAVMASVAFTVNRRIYPVPYEWTRLLRLAGLIGVGFVILVSWPDSAGRNLLLSGLVPVGFILTGGLTRGEWRHVRQWALRR